MVPALGTRWIWQLQDRARSYGHSTSGATPPRPGTRTSLAVVLGPVHWAPVGSVLFLMSSEHSLLHFSGATLPGPLGLASTSQEHPQRSPSRNCIGTRRLIRPWDILLGSWRRGAEASERVLGALGCPRLPLWSPGWWPKEGQPP